MEDEKEYRRRVFERICPRCIDGDGQGNCRLASGTECTISRFFPQVVDAVRSVYGRTMEPYEAALREKVCRGCAQSHDGECALRADVECALDRYFPLVVQAVEEQDLAKRFADSKTGWAMEVR